MVEPNKTTVSDNTENGAHNMVKLTINNCEVWFRKTPPSWMPPPVDIEIPTLCYLRKLNEIGACRVCVVEVEGCASWFPPATTLCVKAWSSAPTPRAREARRVNVRCCCPSTTQVRDLCAQRQLQAADHRQRPGHPRRLPYRPARGGRLGPRFPLIRDETSASSACAASGVRQGAGLWTLGHRRNRARAPPWAFGTRAIGKRTARVRSVHYALSDGRAARTRRHETVFDALADPGPSCRRADCAGRARAWGEELGMPPRRPPSGAWCPRCAAGLRLCVRHRISAPT